jgi:Terpene synthase family 2, C-terminal metal binding
MEEDRTFSGDIANRCAPPVTSGGNTAEPSMPLAQALTMPFPSGLHPETASVAAETEAWLDQQGLIHPALRSAFRRSRFAELAGRVHAHQDRRCLRLASDFISALFVLDDLLDSSARPTAALQADVHSLMGLLSGATPALRCPELRALAAALLDIDRRLAADGLPQDSWRRELSRYLSGTLREGKRRDRGWSSLAAYARDRQDFSAVHACVALALAAGGEELRPEERPLVDRANLSVSFVNDLWSWPKERARGERSNLISVLMNCRGQSEAQAIAAAHRLCDAQVLSWLALAARRPPGPLSRAVMEGWMRGNLDWHDIGTERYSAGLSVALGPEALAA